MKSRWETEILETCWNIIRQQTDTIDSLGVTYKWGKSLIPKTAKLTWEKNTYMVKTMSTCVICNANWYKLSYAVAALQRNIAKWRTVYIRRLRHWFPWKRKLIVCKNDEWKEFLKHWYQWWSFWLPKPPQRTLLHKRQLKQGHTCDWHSRSWK